MQRLVHLHPAWNTAFWMDLIKIIYVLLPMRHPYQRQRQRLRHPSVHSWSRMIFIISGSALLIFVCVNIYKASYYYYYIEDVAGVPGVGYDTGKISHRSKPREIMEYTKPMVLKLPSLQDRTYDVIRVLDMHSDVYKSYRFVKDAIVAEHEVSSRDFRHRQSDVWETETCKPMKEWQTTMFPSCNNLHEIPMDDFSVDGRNKVTLLSHGFWRDVWKYTGADGGRTVLKTMRYEHDYEERNYDRHRRDAVATERLTHADYVVDIFGFCGNSGIYEFGSGGDVSNFIYENKSGFYTFKEALKISVDIAHGLSQAHSSEGDDFPYSTIAHTDITSGQFILVGDRYKLNDFNRCRFIRWNESTNTPCTYTVGNNPGKLRSPEEYAYAPQTEKIDVYSMGNIFYEFLEQQWPFEKMGDEEAQSKIMAGERPAFSKRITDQIETEPAVAVLVKAIKWCWQQELRDRPTSRQVYEFLKTEHRKISNS